MKIVSKKDYEIIVHNVALLLTGEVTPLDYLKQLDIAIKLVNFLLELASLEEGDTPETAPVLKTLSKELQKLPVLQLKLVAAEQLYGFRYPKQGREPARLALYMLRNLVPKKDFKNTLDKE